MENFKDSPLGVASRLECSTSWDRTGEIKAAQAIRDLWAENVTLKRRVLELEEKLNEHYWSNAIYQGGA